MRDLNLDDMQLIEGGGGQTPPILDDPPPAIGAGAARFFAFVMYGLQYPV